MGKLSSREDMRENLIKSLIGETEDIKLTKLSSCGGCGAKVGAGVLAKILEDIKVNEDPNLLVGFDKSDDAAVYRINDDLALVQTVDFFPPIVDDPYIFGAIAATNALSDVYAMGGEPKICLNIMAVPKDMPKEVVHEILRGGYDKVLEANATIAGGHSIIDPEPKYGLSVTGFVDPKMVLTNSNAQANDVLFLTKPLGTGILTTAMRGGLLDTDDEADKDIIHAAQKLMMTLNKGAGEAVLALRERFGKDSVHACTDVTGFGLLGHCVEMALGSDKEIVIDTSRIDILPRVYEFANMGILPEGMYKNRDFAEKYVSFENTGAADDRMPGDEKDDRMSGVERVEEFNLTLQDILFDPQTSGGLLISVDEKYADEFEKLLEGNVPSPQRIGTVGEYRGGARVSVYLP